jgi:hypothetical protein
MREKITSVIFNRDLRDELILKASIQRERFSFERTAKQTLEVYKRFLNKK